MCALVNQEKRARAKAARNQRLRAIREAAANMFLHQPYSSIDLDAIGRTAGVKKGIVSLYFVNREELFLAVFKDEIASWFESVEQVATTRCRWCLPGENGLPVFVCRGLRGSLGAFWQSVRRFM